MADSVVWNSRLPRDKVVNRVRRVGILSFKQESLYFFFKHDMIIWSFILNNGRSSGVTSITQKFHLNIWKFGMEVPTQPVLESEFLVFFKRGHYINMAVS